MVLKVVERQPAEAASLLHAIPHLFEITPAFLKRAPRSLVGSGRLCQKIVEHAIGGPGSRHGCA
jgi:hypothetical protein